MFSQKRNEKLLERLKTLTRTLQNTEDVHATAGSEGQSQPSSFTSSSSEQSRGRSRYEQLTFRPSQRGEKEIAAENSSNLNSSQRDSDEACDDDYSESGILEMFETIEKNFDLIQAQVQPIE